MTSVRYGLKTVILALYLGALAWCWLLYLKYVGLYLSGGRGLWSSPAGLAFLVLSAGVGVFLVYCLVEPLHVAFKSGLSLQDALLEWRKVTRQELWLAAVLAWLAWFRLASALGIG